MSLSFQTTCCQHVNMLNQPYYIKIMMTLLLLLLVMVMMIVMMMMSERIRAMISSLFLCLFYSAISYNKQTIDLLLVLAS